MDDLVRAGKIRYAGACNLKGWQIQKIVDLGQSLGLNPFVTLQVRLFVQVSDRDFLDWEEESSLSLPPAMKLRQGKVFTPVCDSVHGGVSVQGGLCPGVSVQGGLCQGNPSYGFVREVSIPLECILVWFIFSVNEVYRKTIEIP